MQKKIILVSLLILVAVVIDNTQVKLLKIETQIQPFKIKQGNNGVLKLKIEPISSIKIASHPELRIKLSENKDIHYNKIFFNSSELGFKTTKEDDKFFLDLKDKEIPISFKLKKNALIGQKRIHGEIIFTAVFKDNWSLKTYQKFTVLFISRENKKLSKNNF